MNKETKQLETHDDELADEQLDQVAGGTPADDGGEADLTCRKAGGTQEG
jgi:hypothetical protein